MSPTRLGAICLGVAVLPLLAIAANGLGSFVMARLSDGASSKSSAQNTVGGSRNAYLAELSQAYVSSHGADVSHAVRSGSELAPVHSLNQELEQRGAKWRVRRTDGLDAETYDVS